MPRATASFTKRPRACSTMYTGCQINPADVLSRTATYQEVSTRGFLALTTRGMSVYRAAASVGVRGTVGEHGADCRRPSPLRRWTRVRIRRRRAAGTLPADRAHCLAERRCVP